MLYDDGDELLYKDLKQKVYKKLIAVITASWMVLCFFLFVERLPIPYKGNYHILKMSLLMKLQ